MHWSFGIETYPTSLRWEDIMKGPSKAAVRAHTNKLAHYNELRVSEGGMLVQLDASRHAHLATERLSHPGPFASRPRKAA
jgi:hypothetical protein